MGKSAKVAFSLDAALLERIERIRARTGESRSALIARALTAVTQEDVRSVTVRRYVEAYREQPETDEEVARARRATRRSLKHLPWDDR